MKKNAKRFIILLFIFAFASISLVLFLVFYFELKIEKDDGSQKIILAENWQVMANTHFGIPLYSKICQSNWDDNPLFVHIKGSKKVPLASHDSWMPYERWFAVYFLDGEPVVSMPYWPKQLSVMRSPYKPTDTYFGMNIFGYKVAKELGEKWFLDYTGDSLVFSNEFISVSVKPKGGQWLDELEKSGAPVTRKSTY